jgi:hypothetical protein
VGTRAGLDAMVKRKIASPSRESNPNHPGSRLVIVPVRIKYRLSCSTVLSIIWKSVGERMKMRSLGGLWKEVAMANIHILTHCLTG